MERVLMSNEIVVNGKKYIFLSNVERDSEAFLRFMKRLENVEDVKFVVPALSQEGDVLEKHLAVYMSEDDYMAIKKEIAEELAEIEALLGE